MKFSDFLNEPYDMEADFTRAKETLVKLYSEGTHFIYELIQNAEDANATRVSFNQFADRLEVLHDGKPFTVSNIQSLCTIANSDKVNISGNIGKFGIGFLSVFTICKTVELYSEPSNRPTEDSLERFATEIKDFKNLIKIDKEWKLDNPYTTKFVFPYCVWYETDKSLEDLIKDVSEKLLKLSENVLFFLKNIKTIEYVIYKDNTGENIDSKGLYALKREELGKNFFKVTPMQNKNNHSYFIFSKNINGSVKSVDIAFPIVEKNDGVGFVKADVESDSYISAYFPTEIKSELNFIVQAPFDLTPNRSSLKKDSKRNDDLFLLLDELLKEAVLTFRDKNILSLELISLLPYKTMDNLRKLPSNAIDNLKNGMLIKKHLNLSTADIDITDMLKTEAIIPAIDGKYIAAKDAKIVYGAKLLELFEGNTLCKLINQPSAKWLSGDFTKDNQQLGELHSFFIRELKIEEIGSDDLARLIKNNPNFLKNIDEEWLIKFYRYLADPKNRVISLLGKNGDLATIQFIKTTDGNFNAPFISIRKGKTYENEPNIFLRPKSTASDIKGFLFVDSLIEQNCPELIKALDIKEPNGLEYFIRELETGKNIEPNDNTNVLQVKQAVQCLKSDPEKVIDSFKNFLRIKVIDTYGKIKYITCSNETIYREKDFKGVSIKEYFGDVNCNIYIFDEQFYSENGLTLNDFVVLEKLGIKNSVYRNLDQSSWTDNNIGRADCFNIGNFSKNLFFDNIFEVLEFIKKNSNTKERKTELENIKYLEAKQKSRIIITLLKNVEERLQGEWQYRSTNPIHKEGVSMVIEKYLRDRKWLFDKNGSTVSPSEISRYDLDTGIYGKIDEKSNIYEILGFKKTEQDKQSELVQEILSRYTPEQINLIIQQIIPEETDFDPDMENNNEPFPNDPIKNLQHIRENIKGLYNKASKVKREYLLRRIRTSRGKDRAHIGHRYRGYCQICQSRVPYWDVAEIFEDPKKELEQMNLSLCLNCASEYRQLRRDNNLMSSFKTNILNANPEKDT
jgi:hypothetical protein